MDDGARNRNRKMPVHLASAGREWVLIPTGASCFPSDSSLIHRIGAFKKSGRREMINWIDQSLLIILIFVLLLLIGRGIK